MADGRPKPTISRSEWGLLILLATVHFTNIVDFVVIMPLAPTLKERYHITADEFGYAVAAYGYAAFLGSLFGSRFLDRLDRKASLLITYAGFIVGTIACGLAPTYEVLLAARAVAGAFGGVLGASVFAIVGDVFADYRRGTATGAVMSAFAVASIAGLPLGLVLAEEFGSGAPFLVLGGLCVTIWLGAFNVMPSLRGHLTAGHSRPNLLALASRPRYRIAFVFSVSVMMSSFLIGPFIADSLVANVGLKPTQLKYIYLVAGLFTLVTTNVAGRLSDRFGKRRVFRLVMVAVMGTAVLITNLPLTSFGVAVSVCTLFMVTTSARMVPAQALLTGVAPPSERGAFLSLNVAVQYAAMGLSSNLASKLIDEQPDGRLAGYPTIGLIAVAAGAVSFLLVGWLRPAAVTVEHIPATEAVAEGE